MAAGGFITIPDWMQDFDLDIYETIILAVIFGFSQDGDSRFSGSQNYLAKKAKCSKRKVATCLEDLMEKNLILKYDVNVRGIHLCEYTINPDAFGARVLHEVHRGIAPGATNNIEDNIDINNTLSHRPSRFVKPSLEEIRQYCQERNNNIDPETFFNFYEAKGWVIGKSPMKSWKAAIHTWEQRKPETSSRPYSTLNRKESALEHNLRVADQMFGTNSHEQVYGNGYGQK